MRFKYECMNGIRPKKDGYYYMPGLINELMNILDKQAAVYNELLCLSRKKTDAVIKNDLDAIREITSAENELIGKVGRMDKERAILTDDIAGVLAASDKDMTIEYLIELINDQPESAELKEIAVKLRDVITELKEVNDKNRELIQHSLDYIDFSLNSIRSASSVDSAFYTPAGEDFSDGQSFFDSKS